MHLRIRLRLLIQPLCDDLLFAQFTQTARQPPRRHRRHRRRFHSFTCHLLPTTTFPFFFFDFAPV